MLVRTVISDYLITKMPKKAVQAVENAKKATKEKHAAELLLLMTYDDL